MNEEWRKQVTACEHGHQRRKCPHCEINEQDKEIARLRAELDSWRRVSERLQTELAQAQKDRERHIAALEWYMETVANCRKFGTSGELARASLDRDGGLVARVAIDRALT